MVTTLGEAFFKGLELHYLGQSYLLVLSSLSNKYKMSFTRLNVVTRDIQMNSHFMSDIKLLSLKVRENFEGR